MHFPNGESRYELERRTNSNLQLTRETQEAPIVNDDVSAMRFGQYDIFLG